MAGMVQKPPDDSDDPTGEEEALEFDGSSTDQLDDAYRLGVAAAGAGAKGAVGFDDRGQAQWKWITELTPTAGAASGTFDQLKALENPALRLEEEAAPEPQPPSKTGYDPYSTGVFPKPKLGRER
jgi:hypothetical protein